MCEGNHPANYKGCTVYKELQQKKYPALRPKQNPAKTRLNSGLNTQPGLSYAQITKNDQPQEIAHDTQPTASTMATNDIVELKNMVKSLMEQISTVLNLLTIVVTKLA